MNDDSLMPFFAPIAENTEAIIFGFVGDSLLIAMDGTLPSSIVFEALGHPLHRFGIGKQGENIFEMHVWSEVCEVPENLVKTTLRQLMGLYPQNIFEALSRAKQLALWLHDNKFCGRCGNHLDVSLPLSALMCADCGYVSFPRVSPACIVLITQGNKVLLARSHHFPKGVYGLIAGFVEAGESIEACAKREVREEVGLEITNLRWFGSQSWPSPHSLMLGFFAEYVSGELCLQPEEIEDAQWFTRDALPTLSHPSTIGYQMIQQWLNDTSV